MSDKSPVVSGVPQGSALGPLLFLIHLGDIDEKVESSLLSSFADDTNISHSVIDEDDVHKLQVDLNTVYKWATENNMQFNGDKFELLRCGTNTTLKEQSALYTEEGTALTPQSHVKCLGIHISEDGSFKQHISEAIKKAKGMASWVPRTFAFREPEVMLTLWKSLVQPRLDYCSQLWSPHKRGDIQRLEAVQRYFTRQIEGMGGIDYWRRLRKLRLYS